LWTCPNGCNEFSSGAPFVFEVGDPGGVHGLSAFGLKMAEQVVTMPM
jgi:hypothetical protein